MSPRVVDAGSRPRTSARIRRDRTGDSCRRRRPRCRTSGPPGPCETRFPRPSARRPCSCRRPSSTPRGGAVKGELEDADDRRAALLRELDTVGAEVVGVAVRRGDRVEPAVVEALRELRVVPDERIDRDPRPARRLDQERRMAEPCELAAERLGTALSQSIRGTSARDEGLEAGAVLRVEASTSRERRRRARRAASRRPRSARRSPTVTPRRRRCGPETRGRPARRASRGARRPCRRRPCRAGCARTRACPGTGRERAPRRGAGRSRTS